MILIQKLRRGEGPFWGPMKRFAHAVLSFHLPINALTRPVFRFLYGVHVTIRESWIWFRRFFWNEPLFRSQCEAVGSGFQMEQLPYLQGRGRMVIGDRVRLSGKSSIAFGRSGEAIPELIIGDETFIGHTCSFNIGRAVRIGRHCLLAGGVQIFDMDGHPIDAADRRAGLPTPPSAIAPVVIGDDVWIGAGALILKGVSIGDRAIIAARAVVTSVVPANAVVAGNPARVLRVLEQ